MQAEHGSRDGRRGRTGALARVRVLLPGLGRHELGDQGRLAFGGGPERPEMTRLEAGGEQTPPTVVGDQRRVGVEVTAGARGEKAELFPAR